MSVIKKNVRAVLDGRTEEEYAGKQTWEYWAPVLSGKSGARNDREAVKRVQSCLKKRGYICFVPDGIYGAGTQAGVEAFQLANGIAVDGVWGKDCWRIWFSEDDNGADRVSPLPGLKKAI